MTFGTAKGTGQNKYGIILSHTYAIVGTAVLYNNGKPSTFLYKVYNPWNDDSFYTGTYND